jgi:hypothetical protein
MIEVPSVMHSRFIEPKLEILGASRCNYFQPLKGDHLEAQLTGQPAAPIYASAKDKFFYKVVDAQLDFERVASGKVVAVILHQNGQNPRAPRR